jgi:hypothetical protein
VEGDHQAEQCGPKILVSKFEDFRDTGTVYTFWVHHLSCILDPSLTLRRKMGEGKPNTQRLKALHQQPSVCGVAGEVLDPEIVFGQKRMVHSFILSPWVIVLQGMEL